MHTQHVATLEAAQRTLARHCPAPRYRVASRQARVLAAIAAVAFSTTILGGVLALFGGDASVEAPAAQQRSDTVLAIASAPRWMPPPSTTPEIRLQISTKPIGPRQCV